MKLKLMLLSLCISASLPAFAGKVDYYASSDIEYSSIIIKYAQKFPQVRSGEKVIGAPVADPKGVMLKPEKLFSTLPQTRSGDDAGDAHGLNRYYQITLPTDKQKDVKYINEVLDNLSNLPQVELIYPAVAPSIHQEQQENKEPSKTTKAQVNQDASPLDTTPDITDTQSYLDDPTAFIPDYDLGGINWFNVKNKPGAQGEGITIISAEIGHWNTQHSDLPTSFKDYYVPGKEAKVDFHDTSSVGIMAATDNSFGVTGIANKARFGHSRSELQAVMASSTALKPGDVIQIGVQSMTNTCKDGRCVKGYGPMEIQQAWFDAIKTLTDRGIIVIEAAGNGNINFDDPVYEGKFDPAQRDSGAIIVGAVCAQNAARAGFSDYGKRITSSSWGCWDVVTTTANGVDATYNYGPNDQYTLRYSGTSSANPIIAGAAASLSGYAKAKNITLTPRQVRTILQETGTRFSGSEGRESDSSVLGTQPDLVKAFARVDSLQK